MSTTAQRTRTSVSYESTVEKRAGEQVVVIKKTTTETPISARGTEWQKQRARTQTTVLPIHEAHALRESICEAFYYSVDGIQERETEPLELANRSGDVLSTHYSVAEAEERARFLQDTQLIPTPDFDVLVVRWVDDFNSPGEGRIASVVEREAQ